VLPSAQLAPRSQPVLNILETSTTQGTDTIDIKDSTPISAVWDLTLDARPQLDFTLTDPYLSPNASLNTSWVWYTGGRTPSGPNVLTASVLGVGAGGAGGAREQERKPPSNAH